MEEKSTLNSLIPEMKIKLEKDAHLVEVDVAEEEVEVEDVEDIVVVEAMVIQDVVTDLVKANMVKLVLLVDEDLPELDPM
jgi:hypothetical protein